MSPALFRAGFDGLYEYDLIETEDFEEAYRIFLDRYDAVNVTSPFKEKACQKADILSKECKAIGACNILKKTPEGILSANTDYIGVMQSIIAHQMTGKFKPLTLVVGCGGAGKAAAYAARELGNDVIILNRTPGKAEPFTERPLEEFRKWFRKAGTIIYTLPSPIEAIEGLSDSDIRGGFFRRSGKVILEANYKDPSFSESVLSHLRAVNPDITYISGKEWLLQQAVEAYRIFTEEEPNIAKMRKVL